MVLLPLLFAINMPQGIFINDNHQPIVSQTFLPSSLRGVSSVTSIVTTSDVLEGHDTSAITDSPEDSSDPGMLFPKILFILVW